ncbi:ABC transporter [Pelistega indica]|uniref:ABC transporter n=1 Tax=Pelistega indica TaxID=1414851 RepID=V8G2Z2_9BURK|nr:MULTISPECIES: ABC transporter ATP-binding protein [Pelistega]ETD70022.1 ABC transporter [Pelistega indica]
MSLLKIEDINKSYGDFWAVNHVSFDLQEGEMLALIGPNGAGKSTTFNMIGGQTQPNNGSILFKNRSLLGLSADKIWALGIGRTFQIAEIFSSLTVLENVQLALQIALRNKIALFNHGDTDLQDEALLLLKQVDMVENAHTAASEIAYGDVKRLELAMALANHPTLLLMDEPTAGMSPTERIAMMALTKKIAQEKNMAVLFTEHSMDVVFKFADRIIVMAAGSIVATGTPEEIRNNALVKEIYLGNNKV